MSVAACKIMPRVGSKYAVDIVFGLAIRLLDVSACPFLNNMEVCNYYSRLENKPASKGHGLPVRIFDNNQ